MSDQGEKTCPLCAEEMDLTDQQLKPCKCGYQICVWCWHHIMEMAEKDETEGRCPACRSPYNKEKIVGTAANCEKMAGSEKKLTSRKGKSKTADSRKQLSSVRVIQRNLVYIVGLPLSLADEDLLQRKEYFAQYGKVLKVSMSRTAAGAIQQFTNNTCSVYITYSDEEEAVRCIQSVHGFVLDGRPLRACFGTTKYCHAWLRSVPCTNPDCLYLHEIGSHEDSFTKDEVISAYTRSRVQQITGAINSMQRRSGSFLPPPADDYCNNSSASAGKPISKTAANNSATSARGSPPNSSSGRSAALPVGALWGTRTLNNQLPPASASNSNGLPPASAPSSNGLPPASAPSSNGLPPASAPSSSGPLKQKAETCGPLTCSTAVSNNRQVSLPAEAGKKAIHSKESGTSQEKDKIDTLEPVKQFAGADDATYSSEKTAITISPSSSFMNSQLHITQSLKDKDIHLITPSSAANTFDLPVMCNGPSLPKDSYDATDVEKNVCSEFSSLSIDRQQKSHASYEKSRETSPSQMNGKSVISADDVCISRQTSALRLETQAQGIQDTTPEMEDDLLSFNAQRHRDPEVILEKSYSLSPSISLHSSGQLKGYSPQFANGVGPIRANMQTFDQRADSLLQPSSIGELPNGCPENVFSSAGNLGSTDDTYYLSNEGKRMHKDMFKGETATADHSTTSDKGENNLISNILSMDFDPWNESLASQNLVKLLGETDNQQGSLRVSNSRKLQSSNQSRFSFAREEEPMNPSADSRPSLSYIERSYSRHPVDQDFPNSRSNQLDGFGTHNGFSLFNNQESNGFANNYSRLSSNKLSVSRSQMAAPPGFSAPNRAPPPGFTYEKMEQNFASLSGMHMLDTSSLLRNEYHAPSIGNVNNGDIEFMDPAILAVGKGRVQNGLNFSSLDMSPSYPPQPSAFQNEARLQLLMQRSLSMHQNQRFTDNGDNVSPFNDSYGISSRVMDQTLANNLSPFSQLNLPQSRNSVMSNGQWDGWSGIPRGNELGMAELLRSERLGYNKFLNGYEESKLRMPNSGELYNNRTFGI